MFKSFIGKSISSEYLMKIINAQAVSEKMTEEDTKNFLANNSNNLLMRIGTIDEKGEPNVTVTAFYFDNHLKNSLSLLKKILRKFNT